MPDPFGPEEFRQITSIDVVTLRKLELYVDLLVKWQRAINLVGPRTIDDAWRRHIWDSAQLLPLIPSGSGSLIDLGSGAGFPGLVLAIMGVPCVHLVESDHRKAAFLAHVSRETKIDVTVHAQRIEALTPFIAGVVTARALAPLPKLLSLARPFVGPETVCLFLKGQHVVSELTELSKSMTMMSDQLPSQSDPSGTILRLSRITYGALKS